MVAQVVNIASRRATNLTESFVPDRNETYVPFGFYNDMRDIIKSRIFYPIYITGLSGNGKTFMIEQVCAALKRELIRVNITKRTDESDLIGSYELVDGSTIRREGPVITAMRRGAVLLLDECDLGTEDILCLQPILEGKPYFDKKTGEVVHPAAGFNVIATANTKGKGSDDGRFIGTNLLNEAFLERFAITVEQEYPPAATERKILEKNFAVLGITDTIFIDRLITWAEVIRKSFSDGAVDEVISTRRLVHISKAFSIFNNRLKAIEMCLNRFDTDTKTAFLDLYTKVDAEATPAPAVVDWNDITIEHNQSTLSTRFSYKGESVEFSAKEMHEFYTQGLTEEAIRARVLDTLVKIVAAKGVK
jgi:MoxR-like ATPase